MDRKKDTVMETVKNSLLVDTSLESFIKMVKADLTGDDITNVNISNNRDTIILDIQMKDGDVNTIKYKKKTKDALSPKDRRDKIRGLKNNDPKISQATLGKILKVTQKTISNDMIIIKKEDNGKSN